MLTDEQLREVIKANWKRYVDCLFKLWQDPIDKAYKEEGFLVGAIPVPHEGVVSLPCTRHELIKFLLPKIDRKSIDAEMIELRPSPDRDAVDKLLDYLITPLANPERFLADGQFDVSVTALRREIIKSLNSFIKQITSQIQALKKPSGDNKKFPLPTLVLAPLEDGLRRAIFYRDFLDKSDCALLSQFTGEGNEVVSLLSNSLWNSIIAELVKFFKKHGLKDRQAYIKGAKVMAIAYPHTWGKATSQQRFKRFENQTYTAS